MGMIGGGRGGFIGEVHRKAAALCRDVELVAGSFSRDPRTSAEFGNELYLSPDRVYANFEDMLESEARRPEHDRIDFVSIVLPNDLHYRASSAALWSGFHVICDKPLTRTLDEALLLQKQVVDSGKQFGLTHGYLGYPLVTQARQMVMQGEFGHIRKVYVEYPQGWLSNSEETTGNDQAAWRTDPELSGAGGCIADIGTHAHSLAEYVSGQHIVEVSADLRTFVDGRKLDDDGSALFRMTDGANGVLSSSQVCAGLDNGLKISVFGEQGGCEWRQEDPNNLVVRRPGQPVSIYRAGSENTYLYPEVQAACVVPSGHPEGFLDAFANIYRSFARTLRQTSGDSSNALLVPRCPDIDDGVRGMQFIEAMVASSKAAGEWTKLIGQPQPATTSGALAGGQAIAARPPQMETR